MLYKAIYIPSLVKLISNHKTKVFSINTQYNFLKLLKVLKEEENIYIEQQKLIINNYGEKDEKNQFIFNDNGGIKIRVEYIEECANKINELSEKLIQLPDIYFSLDELEPLSLTLEELELLEPFIKI